MKIDLEYRDPKRVPEGYTFGTNDWYHQYQMLLPDGVKCGDCMNSETCKKIFGGNDETTRCQFHPSRFNPRPHLLEKTETHNNAGT